MRRRTESMTWLLALSVSLGGILVSASADRSSEATLRPTPASPSPTPAAGERLTLDQALAIALERSPRLRAAGAAVAQARAAVGEARSAGLPNASLQAGAIAQGPEAVIHLPDGETAT